MHALIAANLDEGHLLPRRSASSTVHAHRVRRRGAAAHGSSAAPSWRRSAARSRKSGRWSSTAGARGHGVGTLLVDELGAGRAREGFDTLCAFTHAPGYFVQHGLLDRAAPLAAREDRDRLRHVPAVPPLRPVRRWCVPLDDRRAAMRRRGARSMADACRHATVRPSTPIAGGVTAPARLPRGRRRPPASRPSRRARPRAARRPMRRPRRPRVFTTNLAQAAPVLVSQRAPGRDRGGVARGHRRQQRLRQRLHRRRRHGERPDDGGRDRGGARLPAASRCWSPRPASSASALPMDKRRAGHPPRAAARSARDGGDRGRARHHDDRSVPEGSAPSTVDDRRAARSRSAAWPRAPA